MRIPVSYSVRNLRTRRLTTTLTASAMALVVFVFAAVLMLAEGLRKTLVQTGSSENVMVMRKASNSEMNSNVDRRAASIVESDPAIALGADGRPLLAKEILVLVNLQRKGGGSSYLVQFRGIGDASLSLRPQVRLREGRLPRPGFTEIAAGEGIAKKYAGFETGGKLRFAQRDWTVVGIFDAGETGYSSEVWADAEQLMQAFRRPVYTSVLFRMRDPSDFPEIKGRIEGDPRLTLEAKREPVYYAEQSEMMTSFLRILGISLTVIFSLGAIIGAMITMYAAVANRTVEIGTLRALGFGRRNILLAFMTESAALGVAGWAAGLFFASFLQLLTISTMNWQTFSDLSFSFALTPGIALQSLVFAMVMSLAGGVLPAFRAARIKIVDALRAG
jgi:ABC-type lipoprotein release transport system permease subunit